MDPELDAFRSLVAALADPNITVVFTPSDMWPEALQKQWRVMAAKIPPGPALPRGLVITVKAFTTST
jgi:hypothetical protein